MAERPRLELAGVLLTLLVCAAFVASFAFGLGGGRVTTTDVPIGTDPDVPVAAGRLEVLNASGRSGMARRATAQLRDAGFDVLYFGNAPAAAGDSSVVIDRVGDDAVARAAGGALGIERVTTRTDSSLYLDATVIVGVDWVPAGEDGRGEALRWWRRLGRWLGRGS